MVGDVQCSIVNLNDFDLINGMSQNWLWEYGYCGVADESQMSVLDFDIVCKILIRQINQILIII